HAPTWSSIIARHRVRTYASSRAQRSVFVASALAMCGADAAIAGAIASDVVDDRTGPRRPSGGCESLADARRTVIPDGPGVRRRRCGPRGGALSVLRGTAGGGATWRGTKAQTAARRLPTPDRRQFVDPPSRRSRQQPVRESAR